MSLRINNNIAAIDAHRNMVNTTIGLSQSMEKLSSGYRINRAADDPAGLVISEQFRAQIAGLNQAIENSEGSINMIQTAEGALTELNSLLVSMRELAIHAANEGFNDTAQLEADQAEIDNALKTIDRIAANTQFGTKKLLDGSNANTGAFTTDGSSGVTIRESYLSDGDHFISAIKTTESTATLNTTTHGVELDTSLTPSGQPTNLTDGVHNLDVIQASSSATKDNGASVVLTDQWSNGLVFGAGAAQATAMGAADLSGGFTSTNNGTYTFNVAYQNGANVTATVGISFSVDLSDAATYASTDARDDLNAAITGTALDGNVRATVIGNELGFETINTGAVHSVAVEAWDGANDFTAATYSDGGGASQVGAAVANLTNWVAESGRGVADQNLRLEAVVNDTYDSSVNQTVTIQFAAGAAAITTMSALVATINGQLDEAVGTGFGLAATGVQNVTASEGGPDDDQVVFTLADQGSAYTFRALDAAVTGDGSAASALGITVDNVAFEGRDAMISLDGYINTIDRVDYAADRNYTLYDAASTDTSRGSVGVTIDGVTAASGGVTLGNLLLNVQAARFNVSLDGGSSQTVIAGNDTIVYDNTREESLKINIGLSADGGAETISNTDQSLVFQIGANVGQTAQIALRDMSAAMLGKNVEGNSFDSLAKISVMTVEGAQDAQEIIDSAINEVSTTRGTLGSFQKNTLESNLRNLRIASQNLQSSESNIRDTDMASEMSNFVKNQILMQAGTAMLSHANQMPQVVLSLFG